MEGGWIDAGERKPTREDADAAECVLAWHLYNGPMVAGWRQFWHKSFFTHWQRLPKPPAGSEIWERALEKEKK